MWAALLEIRIGSYGVMRVQIEESLPTKARKRWGLRRLVRRCRSRRWGHVQLEAPQGLRFKGGLWAWMDVGDEGDGFSAGGGKAKRSGQEADGM